MLAASRQSLLRNKYVITSVLWRAYQYQDVFTAHLGQCEPDLRDEVERPFALLLELGNRARPPVSEPIQGFPGLFELKANTHRKQVRFFYFFQPGQRIVFVGAAFKSRRRLPAEVFRRADRVRRTIEAGKEVVHVF